MLENNTYFSPYFENENSYYIDENKDNRYEPEDKQFFEILGLKLYIDDIIIICILFILYKEKVQDEMLFIALILLLLS